MRALTIRQPWASLIAEGVKTIETRSWSTSYQGRIAIHAGARSARLDEAWPAWQATGLDSWSIEVTRYPGRDNGAAEPLPLGAVVATAVLTDCVRMQDYWEGGGYPYLVTAPHNMLVPSGERGAGIDIADQLPFGDFAAGRWAWLLDDVKPTRDRCPACWGDAALDVGEECWTCEGDGMVNPVPARGRQGLWEWAP